MKCSGSDESQLSSEMVELLLDYQPEGYKGLLLEEQAARTARKKMIGGEWSYTGPVTVCFHKDGEVEIRRYDAA